MSGRALLAAAILSPTITCTPAAATYNPAMRHARIISVLLIAATVMGCRNAARISRANDALRRENMDLKDKLAVLEMRVRELEYELEQQPAQPDSLPPDVRQATPRVVKITIGGLSHARDADHDGVADLLLIYLHPTDGLGRLTQLVGSLTAHAAVLPPNAQAVTIGKISLSPTELRDAYRATFLGIYYSVEIPLQIPASLLTGMTSETPSTCHVQVTYVDGQTSQSLTAEHSVKLKPAREIEGETPAPTR